MTKIFFCFLLYINSIQLIGQELLYEFPIEETQLKDFIVNTDNQGGVYVFIRESFNKKPSVTYLVKGKKKHQLIKIAHINEKEVIGFTSNTDTFGYYFLSGDKKRQTIGLITINKETLAYGIHSNIYQVSGRPICIFTDDDLIILSFDKKKETFSITEIYDGELKRNTNFKTKMPNLSYHFHKNYLTSYISKDKLSSIFETSTKSKVYKRGNKITLVYDSYSHLAGGSPSYGNITEFIEFDLESGKSSYSPFKAQAEDNENWRSINSYYDYSSFYRILTNSNKIAIRSYDFQTNSLINELVLDKKDQAPKKFDSFFRLGKKNEISHEPQIVPNQILKSYQYGFPSIFLSGSNEDQITLAIGVYNNDKGSGAMMGANPLMALASFTLVTAIKQAGNGPGISNYFYATFDKTTFELISDSSTMSLNQKIDEFEVELDKQEEIKISQKSYVRNEDGALFSYLDKKTKTVKIVRFLQ